ncbi:hypothetical protein MMC30_009292 [Trapelia coarctata]|nr:hypothetical protein [Trapelia coarctata]
MKPDTPRKAASKLDSLLKYEFEKLANKNSKVPDSYVFVPKGDVYITRHCRTLTGKLGKTLYIVYDNVTHDRLGLRCPVEVYEEVQRDAASSVLGRRAAVKAKDTRDIEKARNAILCQFPQIPLASRQAVLDHGFQKGSGRVGRSTVLDDDEKVTLAIVAHVRHTMTPYDTLLRGLDRNGVGERTRRETARAMIRGRVDDVLSQWRSSSPNIVLKPVKERPNSKPAKGKNPKTRSPRNISSGSKGPTNTKVVKSKKGAAGPSLEASIHAVKPKPESVPNRNPSGRASATKCTISQELTTSATTSGSARTRGGSKGGFSTTHMTNSLEASMHAIGSFTRSLLKASEVPRRSLHATHMTGSNSLEDSIHAVKYITKAAPANTGILMNPGNGPRSSTSNLTKVLQKKRSRGVDEDDASAKRTKCDKPTAGVPMDIKACYAPTVAGLPTITCEDVEDDSLPFVLDAMHLDGMPDGPQNSYSTARPFSPPKFTLRRTSGRLKHPTRRQLSEMKNGVLPMNNRSTEASKG